jgi:hypothetical protein
MTTPAGVKLQEAVLSWSKQSNPLFFTVLCIILAVTACFADKIPARLRWQSSTPVGRLLLLLVLYIIYETSGLIPAILFSIVIALLWANCPLLKPVEGFGDGVKTTNIAPMKKLWFVERVRNESPEKIIEDRVDTDAVQDNFKTTMGVSAKVESPMGKSSR